VNSRFDCNCSLCVGLDTCIADRGAKQANGAYVIGGNHGLCDFFFPPTISEGSKKLEILESRGKTRNSL
jgi:hypothetical protein